MNSPAHTFHGVPLAIAACALHPDNKVSATSEQEGSGNRYWICGCDNDECWEYGDTREAAICKWNKKQSRIRSGEFGGGKL